MYCVRQIDTREKKTLIFFFCGCMVYLGLGIQLCNNWRWVSLKGSQSLQKWSQDIPRKELL